MTFSVSSPDFPTTLFLVLLTSLGDSVRVQGWASEYSDEDGMGQLPCLFF